MTPSNIKKKRLAGIFLLSWVLFNYPILSLFNRDSLLFGIPVLYVYLFSVWGLIILLMALAIQIRPSGSLPEHRGIAPNPFEARHDTTSSRER